MIKHIVLWKLKNTANGHDRAMNAGIIKARLEALNGRIPGMMKLEVGVDYSCVDGSWDVALYSEFVSRQALSDYQTHPEHEAVKAFVMSVRDDRAVADYEV
ncbi:MAG: Dabb family protein [Candidatus Omnitrophica bacterium]|nr:Dabb family protein [Candidatus Omnitrophota bacterium]